MARELCWCEGILIAEFYTPIARNFLTYIFQYFTLLGNLCTDLGEILSIGGEKERFGQKSK